MRKRSGFGWFEFISGLCMLLLGIFTLARPQSMFAGITVLYGAIAISTGICDIVFYIKAERFLGIGPVLALVTGILSVMAGAALLSHPGMGEWILSVLVPVWFIAHCISRLTHLNMIRFVAGRGYYYFSIVLNIFGLILGTVMLCDPIFSILTTGTLIGIYLILAGAESIVLAFSRIGGRE